MSKVKQILLLRSNGITLQSISKSVGISRNTVKKYLRLIEVKRFSHEQLMKMGDQELEALLDDPDDHAAGRLGSLQELFPYFVGELKRTGVTRWVLWGEYRQRYPGGFSYSQFCDYFRRWSVSQSATMHMEHSPGDKMFIDFTGEKLQLVDPISGELTSVEVYVAILAYSQLTYVEGVLSQQRLDLIRATENAFYYFGGVPKVLVPDNVKSAVTKASKYEAQLNDLFFDFANHYQTSVLPTRSHKPRDKALVESAVNIAYSRIFAPLRNEIFHSLVALNAAIKDLVNIHNNQSFQVRPQTRRQVFEEQEKALLQPLATERFEVKQIREVTVMKNCYVQLHDDHHYYSVPYRYIGRKVKLIYSSTQVSVFCDKERIAFHLRELKAFGYTTHKQHLPSSHQFVSEWNPDKFINWAAGINPLVKDYITHILESKTYPEQTYRSCVGILSQEKKVGRQRLIKAVERATHFGSYNYTTISKILTMGLDRLVEPAEPTQGSLPFHENIRGAGHYQ